MVQFTNQRSIEEFKANAGISKLFIHKSVRRQVDDKGNTTLVPQRYEDGTCKYFASDSTGKLIIAISKACCADLDKSNNFASDRAVIVSDVIDSESGSCVTSLMYSGTVAPVVL